jgi:hypothetical protein
MTPIANLESGTKVMFSTAKGTVKIGKVVAHNDRLWEDEYQSIVMVEIEDGRVFSVDEHHIIEVYGK